MRKLRQRRVFALAAVIMALSLVAAACGEDEPAETTAATTTTAAPTTTQAAADPAPADPEPAPDPEPEPAPEPDPEPEMAMPTEIDVAMILLGTKEEGWYATMIDSINRVAVDNERGLDINLEIIEEIAYADGERVIRDLAQTGDYEIILAHSTYSDAVAAVKDQYPDILFAYSGSGNDPLGGNGYWIDVFIHEPAYLAGIIAGAMTQTNHISGVAAFPFPNVNGPLNAFIDGARFVAEQLGKGDITFDVAYIESWFDPATAQEAAAAQIAAGSDMIYAERFGPFAAIEEADGVFGFGHFTDQIGLSPVVLTSAVARWDRAFSDLIDAWYAYTTEGVPYDAPMERIVYTSMVDGGSALGEISDLVPDEVKAGVAQAEAAILGGLLTVELKTDPIE